MDRREFVKQVGLGLAAGWAVGAAVLAVARPGPRARSCAWRCWPTPISRTAMTGAPRRWPWPGRWRRSASSRRRRTWCSSPATWPIGAGPTPWIWAGKSWRTCRRPVWAVRGEGDHGPGGKSAWVRRWGEPWFSRAFRGFQLLGLDTSLNPGAGGPVFEIGAAQRQWLARELARTFPGHAPDHLIPRPPGPALPPLAAVDRGRPGSGPTAGAIFPGAVPAWACPWSRGRFGQGHKGLS